MEERKDQKLEQALPEGVKQIETEMKEPPPDLKKEGVSEIPSEFPAQAQPIDDSGSLTQTPATQNVTITLPAALQQLDEWSKGDPENALTWFAVFWIRLIKKALHFGWRVVMKGKEVVNVTRSV